MKWNSGRPAFAAELADAYDAVESRIGVTVATAHNRNNAVIVDDEHTNRLWLTASRHGQSVTRP